MFEYSRTKPECQFDKVNPIDGLEEALPSQKNALSDVAVVKTLGRLFPRDSIATVHGRRTTFRVWCEEQTSFPYAAKERALSHKVSNQVEAAYNRTDLLEIRRDLMKAWGHFAVGSDNQNIIQLKTARI